METLTHNQAKKLIDNLINVNMEKHPLLHNALTIGQLESLLIQSLCGESEFVINFLKNYNK